MTEKPIKPKEENNKLINLRKYSFQTNLRLILWFIFLIVFVGLGLVWVFYGKNAAIFGLLCLAGAGIPVGLIALILFGLDRFVKKDE